MADTELSNALNALTNNLTSSNKLSNDSELNDALNNLMGRRILGKERQMLSHVFENNPEIVDYYFTEKGKNPNFQLNKENLKKFKLDKQIPKIQFDSVSGFFKSAASQKDTDLDRFSNLTGLKFTYPLKNSDEQEELNT